MAPAHRYGAGALQSPWAVMAGGLDLAEQDMRWRGSRPSSYCETVALAIPAVRHTVGQSMKFILSLGKLLTIVFWGVVLYNQMVPQPVPLNLLINATGLMLALLHLLEMLVFNASLRGRSHRWFDRLQILLTGIFHIMSIPRAQEAPRNA